MTWCNVLVLNRMAPTSEEGVCKKKKKKTEAKSMVEGRIRLEEPDVVRGGMRKQRREVGGEPALLAAC